MKYILIALIKLYQLLPIDSHRMCRFYPTCSNYAIEAIKEYGSFKGGYLSIKRIWHCRPSKEKEFTIDLVPKKEGKE